MFANVFRLVSVVRTLRIVVDCNVYLSLLIGGSMVRLREHLLSEAVDLVLSEKHLAEIEE